MDVSQETNSREQKARGSDFIITKISYATNTNRLNGVLLKGYLMRVPTYIFRVLLYTLQVEVVSASGKIIHKLSGVSPD
jgi:hypothetical protein